MIITTGKTVRVEIHGYSFERSSDAPGHVVVRRRSAEGQTMSLPTHWGEMEAFISAYRRAVEEDVEYRKTEYENNHVDP